MPDEFTKAESAAAFILSQTPLRPRIGLVLGSGLGGFADILTQSTFLPYSQIEAFRRSTAIGHAGRLVLGTCETLPVAVMQGRIHPYEGYTAHEIAFPIRVFS